MPGTFDQLSRKYLRVPLTVFAGDLAAGDTDTVKATIVSFLGYGNFEIVAWEAGYAKSAGTSPGLIATLERGTTVIDTITVTDAGNVGAPVRSTGLTAKFGDNETLNVKLAVPTNTDNSFVGVLIILWIQPIVDENAF